MSRTGLASLFFCSISTFRLREFTKSGVSCQKSHRKKMSKVIKVNSRVFVVVVGAV